MNSDYSILLLQIHFEDEELRDAIHHLNEFLEKENLKKLRLVLSNSRDEGELEVGLGIHLLSKLAGKAFTSTKKSLRSCPCGCPEKLQSTEKMWIGKILYTVPHVLLIGIRTSK